MKIPHEETKLPLFHCILKGTSAQLVKDKIEELKVSTGVLVGKSRAVHLLLCELYKLKNNK